MWRTVLDLGLCGCENNNADKFPETAKPRFSEIILRNGKITLDLNDPAFKSLKNPGNGVKIHVESIPKPVIVTRSSNATAHAFSSECTHAGYAVMLPRNGRLVCESGHGGVFNLKGEVTNGPPVANLEQFEAELQGNSIIIKIA